MDYEFDESVPFWRSDVDVAALYAKYATSGDELCDELFLDVDIAPAEMRGRFEMLISDSRVHHWTFTPGAGNDRALAIPVVEDGAMVDIVAVGDHQAWGCVTGRGKTIGPTAEPSAVRVYKTGWQWLLFGCDGVLVLDKAAYPSLAAAPQLVAEDLDHADELAYRVFALPAFHRGGSRAAEAAELEARDKVGVDDERYDVEAMTKERVVFDVQLKLKRR